MFHLSGGGSHENEPVPSVLLLPGPAGHLSGLHLALLRVPQIYQTEVQSGLVKNSIRDHTFSCLFLLIRKCICQSSGSTGSTRSLYLMNFTVCFEIIQGKKVKWLFN